MKINYIILNFIHPCTQFDIIKTRKIDIELCMFIVLQLEACAHPFFDDLRDPNACLPNGRPLPPLFDFSAQGKEVIMQVC